MTEGIVIEKKAPVGQPSVIEPDAPGITGKDKEAQTQASSPEVEQAQKSTGLHTNGSTLDTTPKGSGNEARHIPSLERDVSPGTMPDGSHAQTSGDRGESYTPSTMSKFKNKLHIGGGK